MANKVFDLIQEHDIQYIDVRFSDMKGVWHHMAMDVSAVDQKMFDEGIMFDGSSIPGWKAINESDMKLMPDAQSVVVDPFTAQPSLVVICDVVDPITGKPYDRDPRSIAKAAEAYVKTSQLAETAYFGPEAEFFIFDDVRFAHNQDHVFYRIDSEELPNNSGRDYEGGNLGHRPSAKGGYFPCAPVDALVDIRAEMLSRMKEMGIPVEKHHHEVAPAQCELGILYGTLVETADRMQLYKYVVRNVAQSYNKTATVMAKPMAGDNGAGMHVHQSLWKNGQPMFAGSEYAGLSQEALWYIGGIIKHGRAINAFTNPTTNSYKRLIPGFEAPVVLAYSSRNRSVSCRIPYYESPKAKRVEVRFPDPTANPYLAFAAMVMAGLDGIQNKIDPGAAMDRNLYDASDEEMKSLPTVCSSLRQALDALEKDHTFLTRGDVFSQGMIESYIAMKMDEVKLYETSPHPVEYKLYFSA
ncbi:MAG: type I glutamate--ammonia ligase [Alphaproteobacteria bacterium]